MSFWGRLFGSDSSVEKVIDHAAAGLDKLIYTDEEKADAVLQDRAAARQMVIEWLRNTQGQNLARRLLALMIASVWLLQYLAAQVLAIAAAWVEPAAAEKLRASVDVLSENADRMNGAMMLLLSFYFAAPHMGEIVGAAMKKFSGEK